MKVVQLLCTLESICLVAVHLVSRVFIILNKFIVYGVSTNNANLSIFNMNKDLKHMHMCNKPLCHRNIKVLFLFVPCSTPVALEMEASDDYCASKSLYCLHTRFNAC